MTDKRIQDKIRKLLALAAGSKAHIPTGRPLTAASAKLLK